MNRASGFFSKANRNKLLSLALLVILNLVLVVYLLQQRNQFQVLRVAHAGGGIENQTYTNSLQALTYNYRQGFRYFELDFLFSADDHLICLHDWKDDFRRAFGFTASQRVTLQQFQQLVQQQARFKQCTLDSLARWMKQHPEAVIITDIKERNQQGLAKILQQLPQAQERVVPQIYQPEAFTATRAMGFQQIIWTLYRYPGENRQVLKWVEEFDGDFAITMPPQRAKTGLAKALKAVGISSYVHTINNEQLAGFYLNRLGVSEIYTDFLPAISATPDHQVVQNATEK